jgi:glycogen debranching enzyme
MIRPVNRIFEAIAPVSKVLPLPALALATVMAKDGSIVYASSDTLFKGAVFGRDAIEVAEDLMHIKPALVRNILVTLGRLQGVRTNNDSEEEPGKIIHEYRSTVVDGKPIDGVSLKIFRELSQKWGGDECTMAYYASVDATPHFLRALHTYCKTYGDSLLDVYVTQRNDVVVTMRDVAAAAATWLSQKLGASQSGLLEYRRVNPKSFLNHVWKDSNEFYMHESKELANHDQPIASIEVQGLVYDALRAAAYFFPDEAATYQERSVQLRDRTLALLWQPERNYFALGLDFTPQGKLRVIETVTSNPAGLLDTTFFDNLPTTKRQKFIEAIVRRIMGEEFLTNVGIRSRALTAASLVPFWDYHGSYVSWPKETYDIAKGLRRHGFTRLSKQLENRLLNIVLKTRDYPEFVYVDAAGRILAGPPSNPGRKKTVTVVGTNKPERIQAWTVSAVMAILASRGLGGSKSQLDRSTWAYEIESTILANTPRVDLYINPLRLWLEYPVHRYHLQSDQ